MIPRSRPVAIAFAAVAAAQAFLATAGVADLLTKQQIAIANGIIAAATVFLSVYMSSTNVQDVNVAVAMSGPTTAVAGAGSPLPTGEVLHGQDTIASVTPPPQPVKDHT